MIRRRGAQTALVALVALTAASLTPFAGCKKKDQDDHWTGGSSMGAEGADKGLTEGGETRPTARATTSPVPSGGAHDMRGDPGVRPTGALAGDGRPASPPGKGLRVAVRTSQGDFLLELDPRKAPITVKNFLRYVDEKFYDGTIFHRVMVDFMIQGGGFGEDLQQKQPHEPIKNEADNGLQNLRGTIAMARTQVVDSATAQFFVNVKDNPPLDHRGPGPNFGYAVFGKVVEGMEVVDKIRQVPVQARDMIFQHLPTTPVIIKSVRRVP